MLNEGINEPATSPWTALVVIVKKHSGNPWFCGLNQLTVKDSYPLQRVDESLGFLSNSWTHLTLLGDTGRSPCKKIQNQKLHLFHIVGYFSSMCIPWDGMEEPDIPYSECLRLLLWEVHDHARATLETSHDRWKLHYDNRQRSVSYGIGDLDSVKTHPKLDALDNFTAQIASLYSGPYCDTQVLSGVNYSIDLRSWTLEWMLESFMW